jgi:hypothetical protein
MRKYICIYVFFFFFYKDTYGFLLFAGNVHEWILLRFSDANGVISLHHWKPFCSLSVLLEFHWILRFQSQSPQNILSRNLSQLLCKSNERSTQDLQKKKAKEAKSQKNKI